MRNITFTNRSYNLMLLSMRISRRFLSTADGYIHKTKIPMHHFQQSLPRLPLPKLESTCSKYLYFVQPLLSEEQFRATQAAVKDFQEGIGKSLHAELEATNKKNSHTSYISAPWFDMYLEDRQPLAININPQLTWHDDEKKKSQLERATSLISSATKFYRTYRDKQLEPDVYHMNPKKSKESTLYNAIIPWVPEQVSFYAAAAFEAYALDMSQYSSLFCSTRIPMVNKDKLLNSNNQNVKHIVVQRGSEFFKVVVLNDDGTAKKDEEIYDAVKAIIESPIQHSDPVGVLTSNNRDDWAKVRSEMEKNETNKKTLNDIDSAIFSIVLDDAVVDETLSQKQKNIAGVRNFLHGNGKNRWFDKSFQIIVLSQGTSAINFEHSWGDGVAVLRFFEEVYKDAIQSPPINKLDKAGSKPVKMQFVISEDTKAAIKKASDRLDKNISDLKMDVLESTVINKAFPKENKISPDGVMQMSLQLAYKKLTGGVGSTYESANTSAFKHGRTETIRSATKEAVIFTQTMEDKGASSSKKEEALRIAVNNHSKITKDAVLGQGVDRHLFVMKRMAVQKGIPLPKIFSDEGYQIYNKIILSTSTLSSPALLAGGFGPVNLDCYGIGYEINKTGARYSVSTYKDNGDQFLQAIEDSLNDIKKVLQK